MPIRTRGDLPPLFCVHGEPLEIALRLQKDRPLYGVSLLYHPELGRLGERAPQSIEEYAALYLEDVRSVQPEGPYHLCGFSAGGLIAFEMARLLRQQGETLGELVLIEPTFFVADPAARDVQKARAYWDYLATSESKTKAVWEIIDKQAWAQKRRITKSFRQLTSKVCEKFGLPLPESLRWMVLIRYLRPVMRKYQYHQADCDGQLVYCEGSDSYRAQLEEFWADKFTGQVDIIHIDQAYVHLDLMKDPALTAIVRMIDSSIADRKPAETANLFP